NRDRLAGSPACRVHDVAATANGRAINSIFFNFIARKLMQQTYLKMCSLSSCNMRMGSSSQVPTRIDHPVNCARNQLGKNLLVLLIQIVLLQLLDGIMLDNQQRDDNFLSYGNGFTFYGIILHQHLASAELEDIRLGAFVFLPHPE